MTESRIWRNRFRTSSRRRGTTRWPCVTRLTSRRTPRAARKPFTLFDNATCLAYARAHDPALDAAESAWKTAQDAYKSRWSTTALTLAAVIGGTSPDGEINHVNWRGGRVRLHRLAAYLSDNLQALATARYHSDTIGTSPGDTSLVGARLIWGTNSSRPRPNSAGIGPSAPAGSAANDNWGQATLGLELKISDKTWFLISFGGVFDKTGEPNAFVAASNLKWSLGGDTLRAGSAAAP